MDVVLKRSSSGATLSFQGSSASEAGLPFKFLQRMLVLQKATEFKDTSPRGPSKPPREDDQGDPGGDGGNSERRKRVDEESSGNKTTVSDFLTVLSQLVLLGTTGLIIFTAAYPDYVSGKLEEYKTKLTERRHEKMLEFMASKRAYVLGYSHDAPVGEEDTKLFFSNSVYHDEMADDIRKILFTPPVMKYGIVIGAPGWLVPFTFGNDDVGKSRLLRSLASEQSCFSFLSMGLIGGVKSLVDALSEEVGYMEEACWMLKFDKNNTGKVRPVFVLDDLDSLDLDDPDMRKAVRMLFSAANKWAREDTAEVIFTMSDSLFYRELEKFVKRDILSSARVYEAGPLTTASADRLLLETISQKACPTISHQDRSTIIETVGTRVADLLMVCEEINKTGRSVQSVLEMEKRKALETVARAVSELSHGVGSPMGGLTPIPKHVFRNLIRFLDERIAPLPASYSRVMDSEAGGMGRETLVSVNQLWEDARNAGVKEMLDNLVNINVLNFDGSFSSTLMRNAYRKYRNLDKSGLFW
ncbi:hypothetical protein HDU67_007610 [Dinochytrium kinnereticum]|nr:hypothetical protein HDU67_007610 [Dinochytrium kinnereticum]